MEPIRAVSPTVSGIYSKGYGLSVAFIYNKGAIMKQKRLFLYQVDIKYIRDLSNKDETGNVRSVSPQINKEKRPFVGILIICDNKKYCVPLSSPKPKHKDMKNDVDFTKIYDNDKLLGVLNFNNMIPVDESVLIPLNLHIEKGDTPDVIHYKKLTEKQLNWCQQNQDAIISKANKLYKIVVFTPEKSRNLTRRCCNFRKLEEVLLKRLEKESASKPDAADVIKGMDAWAQAVNDNAQRDRNKKDSRER